MKAVSITSFVTVLCLLSSTSHGLNVASTSTSSLTFNEAQAKNHPVSKVIALLKDMLKMLEKDAKDDEDIFAKMGCWCETNEKEKTESIDKAKARVAELETLIEKLTAKSARLNKEIEVLEKEIAANQAALDKATEIRNKQLEEFRGEEKELVESIGALKAAVVVLSKHHPNSALLQHPASQRMGAAASIQHAMQKHAKLLSGVLTHSERKAVAAFVQSPSDYFDATPTFKQAYHPGSGEILGILQQMQESFESNLASSQKEEMMSAKAYEELKTAKEAEIKAGQEQADKKTEELADTDFKNAQAKEDLEDTQESLAADEEYLAMLKEKCSMTDAEYEERLKTRQDEIAAVSQALKILASDDAHDLFTKTFNKFVQQESDVRSTRRAEASKVLNAASQKLHSPRLAAVAMKVRLDTFTKVKKAIDDMVSALLLEKKDEIKHKDFCVKEFNENSLQTQKNERIKAKLETLIADLEMTIKTLTEAIASLKAEIEEMKVQLKRAGEDREIENKEFQLTVEDQRATQTLLVKALDVLKSFYVEKEALLQNKQPAGPQPPKGFDKYVKQESSVGVIGMIETIINDAKNEEGETIRAEADAQKAYEAFVKGTNKSMDAKNAEIVTKSEAKGQAEKDKVKAESELDSTVTTLDELATYKGELHKSCDFILKNFDIRQTARDEEIQALREAKQILEGAKFKEMLTNA